jgi:hypothetical protein
MLQQKDPAALCGTVGANLVVVFILSFKRALNQTVISLKINFSLLHSTKTNCYSTIQIQM